MKELKNLGVTKPEVLLSADPALTLSPAPEEAVDSVFRAEEMQIQGSYICFALRNWRGFEEKLPHFVSAAEYAFNTHGLTPVFVPIDYHDIGVAETVAAGLSVPYYIMKNTMTPSQIIGVMSRMTVVVSMRLHGLIFTTRSGAPLVGIAYDPKVSAFMKYLGQELCCGLFEVNESNLMEMIDKAVMISTDREKLRKLTERVIEAEKVNVEVARCLLNG